MFEGIFYLGWFDAACWVQIRSIKDHLSRTQYSVWVASRVMTHRTLCRVVRVDDAMQRGDYWFEQRDQAQSCSGDHLRCFAPVHDTDITAWYGWATALLTAA